MEERAALARPSFVRCLRCAGSAGAAWRAGLAQSPWSRARPMRPIVFSATSFLCRLFARGEPALQLQLYGPVDGDSNDSGSLVDPPVGVQNGVLLDMQLVQFNRRMLLDARHRRELLPVGFGHGIGPRGGHGLFGEELKNSVHDHANDGRANSQSHTGNYNRADTCVARFVSA